MRRHAAILLATLLAALTAEARYSVVADDGYVYATHPAGAGFAVSVFDVGNPKAPTLVRTIRGRGTPSTALSVSGDVGYVGTGEALHVIDLTCPEEASFLRTLKDGFHDDTVTGAKAVGSSLLVEGQNGVRLYDISDPFTPILSDALDARATAPLAATFRFAPLFRDGACRLYELTRDGLVGRGLAGIASNSACFFVSSSVLYEVDRTSTRIHDFSVPGNPSIRPFTNAVMRPVPSHPRGRLWVVHRGKLEAWNVWKPLEPRRSRVLEFPDPGLLTNAFIRGDICYVNDLGQKALRVFALSGKKAGEIGRCPFPAPGATESPLSKGNDGPDAPAQIVTDGAFLFSTIGTNGNPRAIGVHAVSAPGGIRPVAELPMERAPLGLALRPGTPQLFAVDGRFLHVFSYGTNGLPARLASLEISDFEPYGPQAVAIDPRGFALLACRTDGVKTVNLARLDDLAVTDGTLTGGFARDVVSMGGNVYVSDDTAGLTAYALSDDGALDLFRTIPLPYGSAAGLATTGKLVYLTARELPLVLYDDRPRCVGMCEIDRDASFRIGADARDVALVETSGQTTAFVLDARRGLVVCDVTDPRHPEALGLFPRKGLADPRPLAITAHGKTVYLLTRSGAIRSLDGSRSPVAAKAAGAKATGTGRPNRLDKTKAGSLVQAGPMTTPTPDLADAKKAAAPAAVRPNRLDKTKAGSLVQAGPATTNAPSLKGDGTK